MNVTFTNHLNQRYTFVHIPKTAGKSVSAYILKHATEVRTLHDKSHATLDEIQSTGQDLGHTFAIGRNPYSRAVSLYRYLHEADIRKLAQEADPHFGTQSNLDWYYNWSQQNGRKCTFSKFCEKLPYVPLGEFQYPYVNVNTLFKFEEINKVNIFLKEIFNTNEDLFYLNKTGDTNYEKYYDKYSAKIVFKTYKKDFKALGYSKNINISI